MFTGHRGVAGCSGACSPAGHEGEPVCVACATRVAFFAPSTSGAVSFQTYDRGFETLQARHGEGVEGVGRGWGRLGAGVFVADIDGACGAGRGVSL